MFGDECEAMVNILLGRKLGILPLTAGVQSLSGLGLRS